MFMLFLSCRALPTLNIDILQMHWQYATPKVLCIGTVEMNFENVIESTSIYHTPKLINNENEEAAPTRMDVSRIYNKDLRPTDVTSSLPKHRNSSNLKYLNKKWEKFNDPTTTPEDMEKIRLALLRKGAFREGDNLDSQLREKIHQRNLQSSATFSSDLTLGVNENSTFGPLRQSSPTDCSGVVTDIIHTVQQACTYSNYTPELVQPEREQLRQHIDTEIERRSSSNARNAIPFVQGVAAVNNNLMSHQHTELPYRKARDYINLTTDVANGDISNTSAFASAAFNWFNESKYAPTIQGKVDCTVGTVMNAAGAILGGAHDDMSYKTGGALHPSK